MSGAPALKRYRVFRRVSPGRGAPRRFSDSLTRGLTMVEIAVVILVIGVVMGLLINMIGQIAALQSTEDEAKSLKTSLIFCRRAAIKSNQAVFMEFNFQDNYYRAYRLERVPGKPKPMERILLKKKELSSGNSLVAISFPSGSRVQEGKIKVQFSPEGIAEEMAIYLGPKPEIKNTVLYSRYGLKVEVKEGEVEHSLFDESWKEDLEKR